MNEPARSTPPEAFGRYLLYPAIARGGMATVHMARLVGAERFTRLVAAKRLHPQLADDPELVTMFRDEACIASRIHHPNVVPVLDIVVTGNELILVQEYVHGVPLSQLLEVARANDEPVPIAVVIAVLTGVLAGLHAAHETRDEDDSPLDIVHRDVSPQNVMVSVDGVPRLLDFGIAKARTSTHHTREGVFKGKLAYMAPEILRAEIIDRSVDIYATGVLAWEMLVNRRVHEGRHEMAFVTAMMCGEIPSVKAALAANRAAIDAERWKALVALDAIVTCAMSLEIEDRYATADEMLRALLAVRPSATSIEVAAWVRSAGADFLERRRKVVAANEASWRRAWLSTPISGTQPTGALVSPSELTPSDASRAPSVATIIAGSQALAEPARSTSSMSTWAPPSGSLLPAISGAYRVARSVSSLGRIASSVRASPLLPWAAAYALVLAALAGAALRDAADPRAAASDVREPTTSPVLPPPEAPELAVEPAVMISPTQVASGAAAPTPTPTPSASAAPGPTPAVAPRPFHRLPAPRRAPQRAAP